MHAAAEVQFEVVNNTPLTMFVSAKILESGVWTTPFSDEVLANSSVVAVVSAYIHTH